MCSEMVTDRLNAKQKKATGLHMLLIHLQGLSDANPTPAADAVDVFGLEYFYDGR